MKVFQLHVDSAKCFWIGMALVAAMSYEAAVAEYARNSDSGEFVKSGEIVFTSDSQKPLEGITSVKNGILCDVIAFDA